MFLHKARPFWRYKAPSFDGKIGILALTAGLPQRHPDHRDAKDDLTLQTLTSDEHVSPLRKGFEANHARRPAIDPTLIRAVAPFRS